MKLPDSTAWWHEFWKENNGCLYGPDRFVDNRESAAFAAQTYGRC